MNYLKFWTSDRIAYHVRDTLHTLCGRGRSEHSDPGALLYTLRHVPDAIGPLEILSLQTTYLTKDLPQIVFSRCHRLQILVCNGNPEPQGLITGLVATVNQLLDVSAVPVSLCRK
jgi:hypothetical protein